MTQIFGSNFQKSGELHIASQHAHVALLGNQLLSKAIETNNPIHTHHHHLISLFLYRPTRVQIYTFPLSPNPIHPSSCNIPSSSSTTKTATKKNETTRIYNIFTTNECSSMIGFATSSRYLASWAFQWRLVPWQHQSLLGWRTIIQNVAWVLTLIHILKQTHTLPRGNCNGTNTVGIASLNSTKIWANFSWIFRASSM